MAVPEDWPEPDSFGSGRGGVGGGAEEAVEGSAGCGGAVMASISCKNNIPTRSSNPRGGKSGVKTFYRQRMTPWTVKLPSALSPRSRTNRQEVCQRAVDVCRVIAIRVRGTGRLLRGFALLVVAVCVGAEQTQTSWPGSGAERNSGPSARWGGGPRRSTSHLGEADPAPYPAATPVVPPSPH